MKVSGPHLLVAFAITGGVLFFGLIAGAATGVFNVQITLAPPRYQSIAGAVRYAAFHQNLNLASDGSLKLNGRTTTLAILKIDLDRVFASSGAPSDRSRQPVIIWAPSETPRKHLDAVRSSLADAGWTDVELSMVAQAK